MPKPNKSIQKLLGGNKITTRFRNINIAIFLVVSFLIAVVMSVKLNAVTQTVSKDYANLYSANTTSTLNMYLREEIALLRKASRSPSVVQWFADEGNPQKKQAALAEMAELISLLSCKHLYISMDRTMNEYSIEDGFKGGDIQPFAQLSPENADDAWYFDCTGSSLEYMLNVDTNKLLEHRKVWLNYKVTHEGNVLGVLSASLDFPSLVEQLFSNYDKNSVRGLIIDRNGAIQMDSYLLGGEEFLHNADVGRLIRDEISDTGFRSGIDEYLTNREGHFTQDCDPIFLEISSGVYNYATITPLISTTWSVITLYNSKTLFHIEELLPLILIVLAMLFLYILVTSFVGKRLVFVPFESLVASIAHVKANMKVQVYGTDRSDEIGALANTVQNMKDSLIDALGKVHYDGLTGIYNRRFFDDGLARALKTLSASGGSLSLMLLDIDLFKKYNDAYGHNEGDSCLISVAKTLSDNVTRSEDFAARYGGEEFAIVLPNSDEAFAKELAVRIIEAIRAKNIPHKNSDVANHVTVSIGITSAPVLSRHTGEDFIKRADEALYQSKENGRNRFTYYKLDAKNP